LNHASQPLAGRTKKEQMDAGSYPVSIDLDVPPVAHRGVDVVGGNMNMKFCRVAYEIGSRNPQQQALAVGFWHSIGLRHPIMTVRHRPPVLPQRTDTTANTPVERHDPHTPIDGITDVIIHAPRKSYIQASGVTRNQVLASIDSSAPEFVLSDAEVAKQAVYLHQYESQPMGNMYKPRRRATRHPFTSTMDWETLQGWVRGTGTGITINTLGLPCPVVTTLSCGDTKAAPALPATKHGCATPAPAQTGQVLDHTPTPFHQL
jgi:hypothetical protein